MTHTQETILIEDVKQFIALLSHWHRGRVKVLEHMLEVPEGTVMECDGKEVVLTGDMLSGLKAGISVSLMELGVLPFSESDSTEEPTLQ